MASSGGGRCPINPAKVKHTGRNHSPSVTARTLRPQGAYLANELDSFFLLLSPNHKHINYCIYDGFVVTDSQSVPGSPLVAHIRIMNDGVSRSEQHPISN